MLINSLIYTLIGKLLISTLQLQELLGSFTCNICSMTSKSDNVLSITEQWSKQKRKNSIKELPIYGILYYMNERQYYLTVLMCEGDKSCQIVTRNITY
jgi:hypothetical protein